MAFPTIHPEAISRNPAAFHRFEIGASGSIRFHEPHPFVQRSWPIDWSVLDQAEREDIYEHWLPNRSAFFFFFEADAWSITNRLVGTGDGTTTIFTLPCRATEGLVVRVNGFPTGVTFLAGAGAEGEDQIQFAVAPALGDEIRFDSTGAFERVEVCYAPTTRLRFSRTEGPICAAGGIVLLEKIA